MLRRGQTMAETTLKLDEDKAEEIAHSIAEEIYQHMENDHVKDDLFTWIDLALLMLAFVMIAIIPVWGASFSLFPNVAVKGYQIAKRHKRNKTTQ
jgi:hypothetical protein